MKSAQAREHKTCGWCEGSQEKGERFNSCSRCKVVVYCSKACQKEHWRNGHRDTCQAPSEREEDTVKKAANKTADDEKAQPSKASGKKKPSSSSGGAAARFAGYLSNSNSNY